MCACIKCAREIFTLFHVKRSIKKLAEISNIYCMWKISDIAQVNAFHTKRFKDNLTEK